MPVDLNSPEVRARIVEERWRMAVMDGLPERFEMDGVEVIAPTLTKRWRRITKDLEDIAGLVSDDGVNAYEVQAGDLDSLADLVERIWQLAHDEIVAWASDERRTARYQAWREREEKEAVPA